MKKVKIYDNNKKIKKKGNKILDFFKHYKNKMFRKHFILYIISLIAFAIIFVYSLSMYDAQFFLENVENVVSINTILTEFVIFTISAIILGVIPYINISVICLIYAPRLGSYICNILFMRTYDKTAISVLAVFMLLILTFAITIGMNISKGLTEKIKNRKTVTGGKSENKI